ncbi:MAG: hypothetical protein K0Q75_116 [Anaerospora sp.]|jgi:hypothetical protein|nr:hypothetical protein [Anaerospora sp.]
MASANNSENEVSNDDIANQSSKFEQPNLYEKLLYQTLPNSVAGRDPLELFSHNSIIKTFHNTWENSFHEILDPTNPLFVDAELSDEDKDYHLEYNENGVLWRVNATNMPHPDDLVKCFEQRQKIRNSLSDAINKYGKTENEVSGNPQLAFYDTVSDRAFRYNRVDTRELMMSLGLPPGTKLKSVSYEDSDYGELYSDSDNFSMIRIAFFGHDNPELANYQLKRALDDTMYKDVYPIMLKTFGKAGVYFIAARSGPLAYYVIPVGDFLLDMIRFKSENYDDYKYTWGNAAIDAGQAAGIDLAVGMGAEQISRAIAAKYKLSEPLQYVLKKTLETILDKGVEQIMEHNPYRGSQNQEMSLRYV